MNKEALSLSLSLSERMEILKIQSDKSIRSAEYRDTPSPLKVLLTLIERAPEECYIEYLHGVKALVKYLSPIDLPYSSYPAIRDNWKVPALFKNYYLGEVAKVIARGNGFSPERNLEQWLDVLHEIERACVLVITKEIIPESY